MQLLGILKPDGTLRRAPGAGLLQGLSNSNLCEFLTFRQVLVPTELVERHYEHIRSRSFYPWLVRYMTGGPSYVTIIDAHPSDIQKLRTLLGATRAHLAEAGTLRHQFAPYGGANCFHLSDSEDAAGFEVPLWKSFLGVQPGQFDTSVEEYIQEYVNGPNQTVPIRQLCLDMSSKGLPISSADESQLRGLVSSECYDARPADVDYIIWVIKETCFS